MYRKQVLLEKLREAAASVLPISLIVLAICFVLVPVDTGLMLSFVLATAMLILGMGLFTLGAEMSMSKIGNYMGAKLTKSRKLGLILIVSFLLGVAITVAEPDLQVLAANVPEIDKTVLILTVSVGVGIFLMLCMVRILFGISLRLLLIVFYVLVFLAAFLSDQGILAVAFDSEMCIRDRYSVGTVAYVRQILRLPGDNMRILVEGKYRAQLTDMIHTEPYLFARAMELDEPDYHAAVPRTQALVRQAHQLFEQFVDLAVKSGQENLLQGSATDNAGELADFIAQNATFGYEDKQRILETLPPVHRLELCIRMMAKELDILRLESEINDQVQQNVNQNQRDYYLREQLHVIREELGEDDDSDADSYRTKIKALKLPEETEEKLLREVARFARQQPGSAEASVLRNYLDTVLELPWNKETKERLDVKAAAKILDEDHFGLETVKKRILETLAVRQLAPELPGQILCLVGPPGVGKTSVAISIARALNRKLAMQRYE